MTHPDLTTIRILILGPAAPTIRRSTATRRADLREVLSAMPELAGWSAPLWGGPAPTGPISAEVLVNDRPKVLTVWPSWVARPADRLAEVVITTDRPGWLLTLEDAR